MARALWKGSISFGLVNIPIELHTAVRDHRPKFRMLHAKDKSPVKFERVCIRDGHPVAWEDLVKGYEYAEGPLRRRHEGGFPGRRAREDAHDRHHRFRQGGGDRRSVLRDAVLPRAREGRRARVRAAARGDPRVGPHRDRQVHPARRAASRGGRGHRGRARADRDALRRRARGHEAQFEFPSHEGVRKPELEMAKALVNSLAAEWDPAKYTDQYRENLMRIIQGKMKGKDVELEPTDGAAAGRSRRPDGAAAPQPRQSGRRSASRKAAEARNGSAWPARARTKDGRCHAEL